MCLISTKLLISDIAFGSTYLIDPTPRCHPRNYCPYGEWGTFPSVHPNSEERTQSVFTNFGRMFPTEFQMSKYGHHWVMHIYEFVVSFFC